MALFPEVKRWQNLCTETTRDGVRNHVGSWNQPDLNHVRGILLEISRGHTNSGRYENNMKGHVNWGVNLKTT